MSSLVSEFIINPVLRQARRFSEISRSTLGGDPGYGLDGGSDPLSDSEPPFSRNDASAQVGSPGRRPMTSSTQSTSVESQILDDDRFPGDSSSSLSSPTLPLVLPADPPANQRRPQTPPNPAPITAAPEPLLPVRPSRNGQLTSSLPANDGMGQLRKRLLDIQSREIASADKARLMHEAMMDGYRKTKQSPHLESSPKLSSPPRDVRDHQHPAHGTLESIKFWHNSLGNAPRPEEVSLTEDDVKPTYAVVDEDGGEIAPPVFGCQHYRRNVKLQCSTCHRWYTCRFCHDAVEDHALIRKDTKNMLCMRCACPQRASDVCVNCGETAARYYCSLCKLWDDHPDKSIYHCNDCGICRRGRGLGKDFFHCKTCCACISMSIESSHKCIERSTDCDCPICGEYMFTSPKPVVFMNCGHSIHQKCYDAHTVTSYKCPICNKSLLNMETQFRNIDLTIQSQPMPPEFQDTRAVILCNDCSARSSVKYHWVGLKCAVCHSYNTVELQILGGQTQAHPGLTARSNSLNGVDESQPADGLETAAAHPGLEAPAPISVPGNNSRYRRRQSRGVELRYVVPDRLARSASPQLILDLLADADAEDDDFLGFWRRRAGALGNYNDDDGLSGDGESEDDSSVDLDGDSDDDSDDDILLIGHR